jgi:hypothetical protein
VGNAVSVTTETTWGEEVAVRLGFGHRLVGKLNRNDTMHVQWRPEDASAFSEG